MEIIIVLSMYENSVRSLLCRLGWLQIGLLLPPKGMYCHTSTLVLSKSHLNLLCRGQTKIVFSVNETALARNHCYILIFWYSRFADQEVRSLAVSWIEAISDDELTDLLPQFVQVGVFTRLPCFLLTHLVSVSKGLAMGPLLCFKMPLQYSRNVEGTVWEYSMISHCCHR